MGKLTFEMKEQMYIKVDATNLQEDMRKVAKERGLTLTAMLTVNQLPHSYISLIMSEYKILQVKFHNSEDLDKNYGSTDPSKYAKVCEIFGLDSEKYLINKPVEESNEEPKEVPSVQNINVDIQPLIDKLDVMITENQKNADALLEKMNDMTITMNRLGNVLMQSMEYQKSMMGSVDEIKGCVRQIKNIKK